MGKAERTFSKWFMFVLSLLAFLVIGGLFINGTFLTTPILSFLPLVVHQAVGWLIIILGVIWTFMRTFKRRR